MPITLTDRDGQTHTFADGTPMATIQAELARKRAAPAPGPQPTPLTTPNQMPPGMTPGPMNAKSPSLLEQEMVGLSDEAQRAIRMITAGGVTSNKAMEAAGNAILAKDPTYQARKKQSEGFGEQAAKRSEMRLAGENILGSYAKLFHAFENTPDEILKGAIGPRNTMELAERGPAYVWGTQLPIPFTEGPTTVDPRTNAAVSGKITPAQRAAILNPDDEAAADAWNAQNLFKHDVHGLTNAFVTSAPKGMNMSDSRQAMFESAMGDFMKSTTRQEAKKVLDHAKTIIQNDFNLTPEEADRVIAANLQRIAQEEQRKMLKAAAQVPPSAVAELLQNAGNRTFMRSFNKHFNGNNPGLAEHLITAYRTAP